MIWSQQRTPGGHTVTAVTELADGHFMVIETWADIVAEDADPPFVSVVDSIIVRREVWLNNYLVRDPDLIARLVREAMAQ